MCSTLTRKALFLFALNVTLAVTTDKAIQIPDFGLLALDEPFRLCNLLKKCSILGEAVLGPKQNTKI